MGASLSCEAVLAAEPLRTAHSTCGDRPRWGVTTASIVSTVRVRLPLSCASTQLWAWSCARRDASPAEQFSAAEPLRHPLRAAELPRGVIDQSDLVGGVPLLIGDENDEDVFEGAVRVSSEESSSVGC